MSYLRKLAEAAHSEWPQQWHVTNPPADLQKTMTVYGQATHDYVSACDPQTILALLDELDLLRAQRAMDDIRIEKVTDATRRAEAERGRYRGALEEWS